jgi:serine/threonine protein kinase
MKVAIKSIEKKNMNAIEIFYQQREIEVLKMCQHPFVIKLIDLFENCDYYYIVLEYMGGKDMLDYMKNRNFNISEERVQQLVF